MTYLVNLKSQPKIPLSNRYHFRTIGKQDGDNKSIDEVLASMETVQKVYTRLAPENYNKVRSGYSKGEFKR